MSLNNSRDQFLELKSQYETTVREPFIELLTALSAEFGGKPKVFRPNRDVRFSTDKRPYKTNVSGYLEGSDAMCYLDLSLDGFMAATGYYQMAKDQLVKYRSALTFDEGVELGVELRAIIAATDAKGEGLKTVPRGIPKDHLNADLLGFTSLTCSSTMPVDDFLGSDAMGFAREVWHRAAPLNVWLKEHVGPSSEGWG